MVFSEDDGDDEMLTYTVIEILEDRVILDANHPLAGVTIVFDGTVIGVREAASDEIEKRLLNYEEPLVAYQSQTASLNFRHLMQFCRANQDL